MQRKPNGIQPFRLCGMSALSQIHFILDLAFLVLGSDYDFFNSSALALQFWLARRCASRWSSRHMHLILVLFHSKETL